MQRILKYLGLFAATVISSMLWFWLLFGGRDFACAGTGQSLFLTGAAPFGALAALWGLVAAGLAASRQVRLVPVPLWAFGVGSFFDTFHRVAVSWWIGIGPSLSALFAILLTQMLTIVYLRKLGLRRRDFLGGLVGWGRVAGAGLLGVVLTTAWFLIIPCRLESPYSRGLAQLWQNSTVWYILCGIIPSGITALLYAGETQPSRRP